MFGVELESIDKSVNLLNTDFAVTIFPIWPSLEYVGPLLKGLRVSNKKRWYKPLEIRIKEIYVTKAEQLKQVLNGRWRLYDIEDVDCLINNSTMAHYVTSVGFTWLEIAMHMTFT